MKSPIVKSTFREIKSTFGRYLAIIMIIALGVGFFAGLKVTRPAMLKTGQKYLSEADMYDFRLLSTLGYTDKEVEEFYWFFKQDIYSKLREVSLGQSEFVIDAIGDMRRQGISKKRVVEIMKEYIANNNDLSFREYADMIMYNDE